jgi:hypothetical protein
MSCLPGHLILKNCTETFERYASLQPYASTALALGVVFAHTFEATTVAPIIVVKSPTKRCGKTTIMMMGAALTPRALLAANLTPAAVFRSIEKYRPTLFLDEADTAFDTSDELRCLFNAGHTQRTAMVVRTVGDNHEPRGFSTWCPKWLALIGALPSTLADRSITIPMQRRPKGAKVFRLRQDRLDQHRAQAETIARWAVDNVEALKGADPAMPEALNDREQDNWRPLIAIADLCGGEWPDRARKAALHLSGAGAGDDDEVGMMLLADVRDIFTALDRDRMPTSTLIENLTALLERPWLDYDRHGKALNARGLAALLKPFGVVSRNIRDGLGVYKGYDLGDLEPVFDRYLSPTPPKTGPESATSATEAESLTKTAESHPLQAPPVADAKSGPDPHKQRGVTDVADKNPKSGPGTGNGQPGRVIETPRRSSVPPRTEPW